jgi:hypothetical protein
MATKDSETKQWADPKDYGLPYVEITPLGANPFTEKKETPSTDPAPEIQPEQDNLIIPVSEQKTEPVSVEKAESKESVHGEKSIKFDSKQTELPVEVIAKEIEKTKSIQARPEIPKPGYPIGQQKKKTSSWVWIVAILGFGIVSFIVWQLQSRNTSPVNASTPKVTENRVVVDSPQSKEIDPESTPTDQNQSAVNQDSIIIINNSNPINSNPAQTGTTIANIASGNLIRIDSKSERPQYFIIVGSLPSEKLAMEEASQYFGRSPELYLIIPEEGSRNYRLGLSKFASFQLAAEELARIKSQYTEELWILKY